MVSYLIPASTSGTTAVGITAVSATSLPAGSAPTVTNTGTATAAKLNFGIPAGQPGPAGAAGSAGPAGAAATIAIGTVTTLPPGSSATVTNSGTPSAAILNFGIPAASGGEATIPGTYIGVNFNNPDQLGNAPMFYVGTFRTYDAFSANKGGKNIYWNSINIASGTYDWTALDDIVSVAQTIGQNIVFTFSYVPNYASGVTGSGLFANIPTDLTSSGSPYFNAFVTALVTRYKGRITHYEMWNEPNGGYWGGTVQQLYWMLAPAYAIIKRIDPNAKVVSPGTGSASSNVQYMEQLFSYGYGAYCDIYAQHCYPWWAVTESGVKTGVPEFIVQQINYHNYVQEAYGYSKPMWITEYSNDPASNPSADPVFLAVTYILGYPSGSSLMVWYGYDIAGAANLDGGAVTSLNSAGVAFRQVENWLLGSTWITPPTRQALTSQIRNPTMSAAVAGTPGTLPTYMSLNTGGAVTNGVTTSIVSVGSNYIDLRVYGTPTATSQLIFYFEQWEHVSAAPGQQHTLAVNLSLTSGSLANAAISFIFAEFDSSGAYVATDSCPYGSVYPTSYSVANQTYVMTQPITNSQCASIIPGLTVNYSSGQAIDFTLRISNPTIDHGTQWVGTLQRSAGGQVQIAWDAFGATVPSTLSTAHQYSQNISGVVNTVSGGNVTLTNSPIMLYS